MTGDAEISDRRPRPHIPIPIPNHLRPVAPSPRPSVPASLVTLARNEKGSRAASSSQTLPKIALVSFFSHCRQSIHRVELACAGSLIVKVALHFPVSKIKRSLRPTIHTHTVRVALM